MGCRTKLSLQLAATDTILPESIRRLLYFNRKHTMSQPNILYIMTDQQLAAALGCVGHPVVKTPNLDRLAARGVVFDKAYCPSPVCGPSRTSQFAGLYPGTTGAVNNPGVFKGGTGDKLLPILLREKGYSTALVGKLHIGPANRDFGFKEMHLHDSGCSVNDPVNSEHSEYVSWLADKKHNGNTAEVTDYFDGDEVSYGTDNYRFIMGGNRYSEEDHYNTWVTDRSIDFIRSYKTVEASQPFFLFTSYFGPHQPMQPPEPWASMYDPDTITLPPEFFTKTDDKPIAALKTAGSPLMKEPLTEKQYREILAAYYGQISMIDDGIGKILDELDQQGLTEDTIIVMTADHGDHAGQFGLFFKSTMYENAVKIPLIISVPQCHKSAGQHCRRIVNNIDLYTTLLEYAGITPPPTMSRSLISLLNNPEDKSRTNETYSEIGDWSMVVKDNLKLIRMVQPDGSRLHELYDINEPVPDSHNLFDKEEYASKQEQLIQRLDEYTENIKQAEPIAKLTNFGSENRYYK